MYYVYKTTNIVNNKIYIGVHKSDSIQNDEYIGSGKYLNSAVIKYGKDKFKRQILYQFESKEKAYLMQSQIVDKQFVKRKDTYNTKLGGDGGWDHLRGTVTVKDKSGNTSRVSIKDYRYLSGQLQQITKDTVTVLNDKGQTFRISKNDLRYINGQVQQVASKSFNNGVSGIAVLKDCNNNTYKVRTDDIRYKTGQIFGITKGKILVKDQFGNRMYAESDDPRWLSGQLVGVARGMKHDHGHQLGQKNSQYGTMWITNGSQNKKIKKLELIPQGWKKGRICKVV